MTVKGGYAGFSAAPEQIAGATVAAPTDTINLTMRGKINYLARPAPTPAP
ncbi:hypothetical protein AB0M54_39600 [Actinoplanes sp. NPDC051470]